MFKQSSHRNQRTKGFKVKHAVQLCLLIGVCIWLLYQVRHSRGKNTSDQENSKVSDKVKGGKEILNLGRKHLHPKESGDTKHRLNDDNITEDTAGKETGKTADGAREGTKQERKGEDKGDAGDMENDHRNRRGEDNENEKKNRDQENGGDKENVKANKDQEIPEEHESQEATKEKHVDENNSHELQEKGTEENEAAQEGKSTEQSSGRGSTEDNKVEEGLSRSMEERSKKSEVEFDGTTDKSNDVEKKDRATGESTRNSPNKTEIQ